MDAVKGTCAPPFEAVRREFARMHSGDLERGSALSVVQDGRTVVDLWIGDSRAGRPWADDTICCGFSVAKAVSATAVALLVDRGVLELDAPVARYWPEFAAAGKEDITLRDVLTHRAATNYFPDYADTVHCDDAASFGRLDEIWTRIAAAAPLWEPRTRVAYTSMTIGWIISALVVRTTGRSLRSFVAEEIARPLGLVDLYLGVPERELDRTVDLVPDAAWESDAVLGNINPDTTAGRGLFLRERTLGQAMRQLWNDDVFRQSEQGAINLTASARDLARFFAVWAGRGAVGDVRLFSEETAAEFMTEQAAADVDAAIGTPMRLGLALWLPVGGFVFGPHSETVAHIGLGGAVGLADPVANVSIAYLPGELRVESVFATDVRLAPAIDAVFAAVA